MWQNILCLGFKTRMALSFSKKLSVLWREITSKYDKSFCCLNGLHSLRTKYKLESPKKVCENKDFCNAVMPSENTNILGFSQFHKSDKT